VLSASSVVKFLIKPKQWEGRVIRTGEFSRIVPRGTLGRIWEEVTVFLRIEVKNRALKWR
jgi:hypothetical protein